MWQRTKLLTCRLAVSALLVVTFAWSSPADSSETMRSPGPQTMVLAEDGGWGYATGIHRLKSSTIAETGSPRLWFI